MSLVRELSGKREDDAPAAGAAGRTGILARSSNALARCEAVIAGLLASVTFALLLLNVVTRAAGSPLIWVDELAIYAMIWMAFMGTSLAIRHRGHIAVTLLSDGLRPDGRRLAVAIVDALLLSLMAVFVVLVWNWFDPVGLLEAGDLATFGRTTFNFIYQEPTTTLGLRKVWFWLIMPVFALCGTLHAAANLADSVRSLREGGMR